MDKLADINGELMMIWGKQDTHIPYAGRTIIREKLTQAEKNFTWHEFNGQHGFMRDGDARYDAQLASNGYHLSLQMFGRAL